MPNLNAEAHFAQSPIGVDVGRSTFDRSHNWKGTFNAGKLNCVFVDEILPGDDVSMRVSELVRMTTPLVPTMDDCYLDLTAFFVPYRLVWSHWKEMNGENNTSSWIQPITYTVPTIQAYGSYRKIGDLGHQMGIPPIKTTPSGTDKTYSQVHALELRSYREIWNSWWRDQNTQSPQLVNTGDTETDTSLFQLLPVDRVHDMFGSCLPGPQKGEAVKISLSGFAPVYSKDGNATQFAGSNLSPLYWSQVPGGGLFLNGNNARIEAVNSAGGTGAFAYQSSSAEPGVTPRNLFADMSVPYAPGSPVGVGIDVNELRLAVQTQRILEKLSIGGKNPVAA